MADVPDSGSSENLTESASTSTDSENDDPSPPPPAPPKKVRIFILLINGEDYILLLFVILYVNVIASIFVCAIYFFFIFDWINNQSCSLRLVFCFYLLVSQFHLFQFTFIIAFRFK